MAEPPGWEAWAITRHRNSDTLARFLERFVDRAAAEDQRDEQLSLLPLDRPQRDFAMAEGTTHEEIAAWLRESFDWEPAITLTHSIARGLSIPWRAFSLFGLPSCRADLMSASVRFTPDGELVLALEARTLDEAITWLKRLAEEFDADLGLVAGSPPGSRAEAEEMIRNGRSHYHWRRQPSSGTSASARPRAS
jgi:hypothetical protein